MSYSNCPCVRMGLQSTLPHGERLPRRAFFRGRLEASIHAPARGATRAESLHRCHGQASIHAPARGATHRGVCARPPGRASIHAPARGATWSPPWPTANPGRFNPRSRTGSDSSICGIGCRQSGFNPRSRTGSDFVPDDEVRRIVRLQSTLPHGERPTQHLAGSWHGTLQSTLPHGERQGLLEVAHPQAAASIHAPARGATRTSGESARLKALQSTLPHGERQGWEIWSSRRDLLQSTLPHGERP